MVTLAATGVLLLGAAACGDDDASTGSEGAGNDDTAGGGSGDITIEITGPSDGDQVDSSGFEVAVDSSVPIDEPDTGEHHVHLYYDGNTADGEYDIVYEDSFTVDRLDEGEYTVEAYIANADHSLTDARDEITVQVGGGASTGGSDGSDDPDPYDY